MSVPAPIRRSSCREAGSWAQAASCPWVIPSSRSAPAFRRAGAISPSGAAAPNHTEPQPSDARIPAARRVTRGVGSSIVVRSRTTWNGCSASKRATSAPSRQVEAYTTICSAGMRTAMLCTNVWIPPGRGGKSLVTISVLFILRLSGGPTPVPPQSSGGVL